MDITLEKAFLTLPGTEREAIIRYGAVLRLSSLERQLALAEQKVRQFEAKYRHGSSLSYKLPTGQLFAIIGLSKTEHKEVTCGCTTR